MTLRILKLTTGEEIVGELESDDNGTYRIKQPCLLGIAMGPQGKPSLQMQPMLLFSDQKVVSFKDTHVLYDVSVAIEIQNKYNEIYGSGIVIPKQSPIALS
jgi:hypothetical protein